MSVENTTTPGGAPTLTPEPTSTERPFIGATATWSHRPTAIRPFSFHASDEELAELKRRYRGDPMARARNGQRRYAGRAADTIQKLADHWLNHHDWRKVEARINGYPNFVTEIDGLDMHFIHVKSKHEGALPLIVTHGWPGSVIEQLKIIDPLTDPTAHGGTAADAFDIVIPSMPGYGFSGKPSSPGWGPERIASGSIALMKRLGYEKFVASGGDWGALVTDFIGVQAPPELLGIHTNMAGAIPPEIDAAAFAGAPAAGTASTRRSAIRLTTSRSSTSTASAMRRRWRPAPRRSTGSRILRSLWRRGSSTTTSGPIARSRACSMASKWG